MRTTLQFVVLLALTSAAFAQAPTAIVVTDGNGKALTISGATPGTRIAQPLPVVITDANGVVQVLSAGGGVISSGASLPALPCTASTLFNVLGAGGLTDTLYRCTGTGGGGFWQQIKPTLETVYAKDYGVLANGGFIADATVSNGGTTITCPNNDCNFTSSNVGNIVFLYANLTNGTSVIPQTTILTVNSAQSITVASGTASSPCTANCALAWGPDDSAALDRGFLVAANSCLTYQLPAGVMLTQQPQFNYQGTCSTLNNGDYLAPNVYGAGSSSTTIIPTPNFNPAAGHGCFTIGTGACFFGINFNIITTLSIKGFGYGAAGLTNKALVENNSGIFQLFVAENWCPNCAGTIGYYQSGSQVQGILGGTLGFGATTCYTTAPTNLGTPSLLNWPCTGSAVGLEVAGGSFKSIGNVYQGSTAAIKVDAGTFMDSDNDADLNNIANNNILVSGTMFLRHYQRNANSGILQTTSATAKVLTENTVFVNANSGAVSGTWYAGSQGSTVTDLGGNTFPSAAIPNSPALVQSRVFNQGAGASIALAFSSNLSGSATRPTGLMVFARSTVGQTITGCTDTVGNTISQNGSTLVTGTVHGAAVQMGMFTVSANTSSAADTVTCTFSGSVTASDIFIAEWSGTPVAGGIYDGSITTASGSTTAIANGNISTTNNSDVVGFFITANGSSTLSINSCAPNTGSCIAFSANTVTTGMSGFYQPIVALLGSTTMSGTLSGALDWQGFWFQIKPYAAYPTFQNYPQAGTCTFSSTTCTLSISNFAVPPTCLAGDQTAAAPVKAAAATVSTGAPLTAVVLTGGTGAGVTDIAAWQCK